MPKALNKDIFEELILPDDLDESTKIILNEVDEIHKENIKIYHQYIETLLMDETQKMEVCKQMILQIINNTNNPSVYSALPEDKIKELTQQTQYFHELIHAYEMQSSLEFLTSQLPPDDITIQRNKKWMETLKDKLTAPSFIVVGIMHLQGKDGLIDLLQVNGFTVQAVECPRETLAHERQFDKVMQELKATVPVVFSKMRTNDFPSLNTRLNTITKKRRCTPGEELEFWSGKSKRTKKCHSG